MDTKAYIEDFSQRLKEVLQLVPGDSIDSKARALGTTNTTVYSYLNAKTLPSALFLKKLKEITDVDLDWLFTGQRISKKNPGEILTTMFDFISAHTDIYIHRNKITIERFDYASRCAKIYNFLLTGKITGKYFDEDTFQDNVEEIHAIIEHLLPLIFDNSKEDSKTYLTSNR